MAAKNKVKTQENLAAKIYPESNLVLLRIHKVSEEENSSLPYMVKLSHQLTIMSSIGLVTNLDCLVPTETLCT